MQQHNLATFDSDELAVVLSHYGLGVVESVTPFARGSRRSPKVGIVCRRGKFLLKRRRAERARLERVRFAHRVQEHLVRAGFPLARLVPTSGQGSTLLRLRDHIYELFEFVPGHEFARTPGETRDAGAVLAQFHQATDDFVVPARMAQPRGDYHDVPAVRTGLCAIDSTLSSHDSYAGNAAELAGLVQFLLSAYDRAADTVNRIDLSPLPERVTHADWHPGNLLFREEKVVAVVDYDSMRYARRIVDVANGALQFSMIAGGDPAGWPDQLDQDRFHLFMDGYESVSALAGKERTCMVPLMTEALIAECVAPIAATGAVGRWAGYRVLQMVRRKLLWFESHSDQLIRT